MRRHGRGTPALRQNLQRGLIVVAVRIAEGEALGGKADGGEESQRRYNVGGLIFGVQPPQPMVFIAVAADVHAGIGHLPDQFLLVGVNVESPSRFFFSHRDGGGVGTRRCGVLQYQVHVIPEGVGPEQVAVHRVLNVHLPASAGQSESMIEDRVPGGHAPIVIAVLIAVYVMLWALLNLADYALVVGSVMVFAALSITMYATRNVNWYNPGESEMSDMTSSESAGNTTA